MGIFQQLTKQATTTYLCEWFSWRVRLKPLIQLSSFRALGLFLSKIGLFLTPCYSKGQHGIYQNAHPVLAP
jgi:hypothetical protein